MTMTTTMLKEIERAYDECQSMGDVLDAICAAQAAEHDRICAELIAIDDWLASG